MPPITSKEKVIDAVVQTITQAKGTHSGWLGKTKSKSHKSFFNTDENNNKLECWVTTQKDKLVLTLIQGSLSTQKVLSPTDDFVQEVTTLLSKGFKIDSLTKWTEPQPTKRQEKPKIPGVQYLKKSHFAARKAKKVELKKDHGA